MYQESEFCLKQSRKISDFCLKKRQGMRGRAAPLYRRIYRVPPPPPHGCAVLRYHLALWYAVFHHFGKRRSFTVWWYHLFALSCLIQVNTMCSTNHSKLNRLIKVNILKTLDLGVNDYTIYDEIGRASNYRAFRTL